VKEGEREGWASGWAGQPVGIFKVRVGLEEKEIEGRGRVKERKRDIEINRHRERADYKNPKQSQVAQLVINKFSKPKSCRSVLFLQTIFIICTVGFL
jgi:hypothetical protein